MTDKTTRFDVLADASARYGRLALENYTQIRHLAEGVATGFCAYLGGRGVCAHLVPPAGPWAPQPFGSGAYSVSGRPFLPLEPISFGLAVRVSRQDNWLRLVFTASKSGENFTLHLEGGRDFDFSLPLDRDQMTEFFDHIHGHLVDFFEEHADRYEHGEYGGRDIGFDFVRGPDAEDDAEAANTDETA